MDFRSITDPFIPAWVKAELQAADLAKGEIVIDDDQPTQRERRSLKEDVDDVQVVSYPGEDASPTLRITPKSDSDDSNLLWPVAPLESGEGLPYAPIDWPRSGDTWRWRVGRRYNAAGYFQDRFLYPPVEILPAGSPKYFASKAACKNFLKTYFPGEDHDAFFSSFSWKVPAKIEDPSNEERAPATENPSAETVEEQVSRVSKRGRNLKTNKVVEEEEDEKENPQTVQSTQRRRRKTVAAPPPKLLKSAPPPKKPKGSYRRSSRFLTSDDDKPEQQNEKASIPEDFDSYLDSIEEMLTQTNLILPCSHPATDSNSDDHSSNMVKARAKLSSLLAMDFSSLATTKIISQLTSLASSIRSDPTLTADQLVKLKLIDELPLYSEVYAESKKTIAEVDRFFTEVEENKMKVSSMRNEYRELKDKTEELQAWVDSGTLAVKEIEDQIAELTSRRAELTRRIEANKAAKVEVGVNQRLLAGSLPLVVQEIQSSNLKIPEMEMKKMNAQRREAEVLEKFSSLKGFSL